MGLCYAAQSPTESSRMPLPLRVPFLVLLLQQIQAHVTENTLPPPPLPPCTRACGEVGGKRSSNAQKAKRDLNITSTRSAQRPGSASAAAITLLALFMSLIKPA